MPYIPQKDRSKFTTAIGILLSRLDPHPERLPGELNYIFSKILNRLVDSYGERYYIYNMIVGVLECTKEELYRQRVAPYEDKAIQKNGDLDQIDYE